MAVYTEVADEELAAFVARFGIGELLAAKGIAEGVENSNYFIHTSAGFFILTLYEKRVSEADLPFFLGLMEHLSGKGLVCPRPVRDQQGEALGRLAGRPAAIVTFLDGISVRRPSAAHCRALGEALGASAQGRGGFSCRRARTRLSVEGWRPLFEAAAPRADSVRPGLAQQIEEALTLLERQWPKDLPHGNIHADLFPDNVFFIGDEVSGVIDFYFACTDALSYDLAVCLNAWCFEPDGCLQPDQGPGAAFRLLPAAGAHLSRDRGLAAARSRRRLALPPHPPRRLAERAARRLGETQGSDRISAQAPLSRARHERGRIWPIRMSGEANSVAGRKPSAKVTIFTDGACSGNPGRGGYGAILVFGDHRKEIKGGEANTTNNRMELMAAIAALEALKRPCAVELHTDSQYLRLGITQWLANWKRNGWRTAARQARQE